MCTMLSTAICCHQKMLYKYKGKANACLESINLHLTPVQKLASSKLKLGFRDVVLIVDCVEVH